MRVLALTIMFFICSLYPARAAEKYLFYMHGAWIEQNGLDHPHPRHGLYKYEEIVRVLEEKGFVVISEARLSRVSMPEYAEKVANQIRRLLAKGVPPENITVAGHSKGGHMSLLVASILGEDKINFVVMAACGKKGTVFRRSYEKFLENRASKMRGRILSIYDASDRIAGTCQTAFNKAPGVESSEIVLTTSHGHGIFYSPDPAWVDEIIEWAGGI